MLYPGRLSPHLVVLFRKHRQGKCNNVLKGSRTFRVIPPEEHWLGL
ncbi:rCG48947 [Rattus norvegicus]|uniref:RCG48947 n=1 Tax=Rattus norvegicus TaxID=10116 RepID=A6IGG3_RAT|nr:rCG48947 [Rattus norvegicus]